MNSLKALLITGLIGLCSPALLAGNPAKGGDSPPTKPDTYIHDWCEIRGVLERVMDSDGNVILLCRMVANDFCFSTPCLYGMPLGNKPAQKNPVPQGLNIEEGQNFIAYYDSDNTLKVVLTEKLDATLDKDQQGIETLTVVLPR